MPHTRIFISYSHDSVSHVDRVRALADHLREEGIDARLDQYELAPPQGWPRWIEDQIEQAAFIVAICTKTYKKRLEGKEAPGTGLGAQYEGKILTTSLYKAIENSRVIPVVFRNHDLKYIPTVLSDVSNYDLDQRDGYEKLYRRLTNQPRTTPPPIGATIEWPPVESTTYPFPSRRVEEKLRNLPSLSEGHYELCATLPFGWRFAQRSGAFPITAAELINVCKRERRGFGALLDALRRHGEPLDKLLEVCRLLDDFHCRTVAWSQIIRLKVELEKIGIPDEEAQRLYHDIVPPAESISNCQAGTYFTSLLDLLSGFDASRLIEFVVRGLACVERNPGGSVLAILKEIAADHELNLARILARCSVSRQKGSGSALLYLIVIPDRTRSLVRYRIRAWLRENGSTRTVVDNDYSIDGRMLEEYLPQIILDAPGRLRDPFARLHLEVVLPIDLLHLPIDRWILPIDDPGSRPNGDECSRICLGAHWPLTVRFYERLYDPRYRWTWPEWRAKWQQRPCSCAGEENVFWIETAADFDGGLCEAKALLASLDPMGGPGCRRLQDVLHHSIPVALWLRKVDDNPKNAREEFRKLICCEDFDGLPHRLWEKRRSSERRSSVWTKVSLLWDDPDQLPPEARDDPAPFFSPEE